MVDFSDKKAFISKELQKLAHGESMPWTELSCLLDQVDKTGYWEQTANSFTDWLKSNAHKLGGKESTLWRYLVVGRYYHDLREQFTRVKLEYPPLLELPKHVSPEKLELLSKLGRVAPKDFFEKLIYDVLDNAITRDEIREQWKAFRPALKGKTARGRNVSAPTISSIRTPELYKSLDEALIINAIKANGAKWLGDDSPSMYEVKFHFLNQYIKKEQLSPHLPAVVLYQSSPTDDLEVHGIEMARTYNFSTDLFKRLKEPAEYCDFLWIACNKTIPYLNKFKEYYPETVGIIVIDDADITVQQPALPCKKNFEKANILLKALLLKESR